jgi:hypothetical protein
MFIRGLHLNFMIIWDLLNGPNSLINKRRKLKYMDNTDQEKRIKELEEENKKLKIALQVLRNKLASSNSRVNKMYEDSYNDVTPEREDR